MEDNFIPNPDIIFPIEENSNLTYIRPTIKNPNIIVGDFSYFADKDFESHVTHHYDFIGDKLIIGKFCQIGSGVNFIMNGANHKMSSVSTYPFYIFKEWETPSPPITDLPIKGDTIVGNDVWIGQNTTILPGVHIGDGVIIGTGSTVGSNVPPYTIVVGNPTRLIRKRFDDELTELLLKLKWWNKSILEVKKIIPLLSNTNLEEVKRNIYQLLSQ